MRIDPAQVEHIANLSRLSITDEEKNIFGSQLSKVLDYIEQLNELDTSDIEPTSHVLEISNVLREDSLRPSLTRESALRNAPDKTDKFYRVPQIIE